MDITTEQRSYKAPPKRLSENLENINTRTYLHGSVTFARPRCDYRVGADCPYARFIPQKLGLVLLGGRYALSVHSCTHLPELIMKPGACHALLGESII